MESIINTDMSDTISPVIFSRAEMYEGIMYIISPKANMLYEYDVAREDIKEYKGYVSDDTVLAWTSFEIESKIYKLEYWIKYLKDL